MKVLRYNDDKVLDAEIEDIRIVGDKAVVSLRTYAKGTLYKLVMTGEDMETMRLLFNKGELR